VGRDDRDGGGEEHLLRAELALLLRACDDGGRAREEGRGLVGGGVRRQRIEHSVEHGREVAQAHERGHAARGAGRLRPDAGGRDELVVDGRGRADVTVAHAEERWAPEPRGGLLAPNVEALDEPVTAVH
jgi:hypothetical protein